jgi:hypothetical protein
MPIYVTAPQIKATVGGIDLYTCFKGSVCRVENGFDTGDFAFSDLDTECRSLIISGATIIIAVKDEAHVNYTTIFKGTIRFADESVNMQQGEVITAVCDGAGYGFAETLVAMDYGVQSDHSTLDTLNAIITDSTYGLVPAYVHKILGGATSTGYSYDTSAVDVIMGTLNYLYFPYKPCSKALTDICNLVQAIKGANAGPHWIVTPGSKLLVSTVGNHSAAVIAEGWTTYVDGSQSEATVTQGIDFVGGSFKNLSSEANYILYHSPWQKPGDGDYFTEIDTEWTASGCTVAYDASVYKVGAKSVKVSFDGTGGPIVTFHNATSLHLDLTKAGGKYNRPTLSFYVRRNATFDTTGTALAPSWLKFYKDSDEAVAYYLDWSKLLTEADTWYRVTLSIGPFWEKQFDPNGFVKLVTLSWLAHFSFSDYGWDDVNKLIFEFGAITPGNWEPNGAEIYIDGLTFNGYVIRGAKNSTKITADTVVKMRCINDPFGKDDTLNALDDSGNVARLAYAELLRLQSTPTIATFTTPLMLNALPGQLLHIHALPNIGGVNQIDAEDYRITQLVHSWNGATQALSTTLTVTSDVVNSKARAAYDSQNEIKKNERPEYQDAQATGIKMRDIDITQSVLEVDYPS